MQNLKVKTDKEKEIVDITDEINSKLKNSNLSDGFCQVFVAHTTCALTTADLDPGTDEDFLDAIEKIFPKGNYRHPHNPTHVGDHIMSSIIGQSVTVPVKNNELILGTWQRIVLVELNGPKERNIVVSFQKS
jgi:secondary thiamine-phosphate synthase enzyme